MKNKQWIMSVFLAILSLIILFAGGNYYISNMRQSLWSQSVSEVLEVTNQGCHSFEVFVDKDLKVMNTFIENIEQFDSLDDEHIMRKLSMFEDSNANYVVMDLDHGVSYSNRTLGRVEITQEHLNEYRKLDDFGILEPYISEYTQLRTIGYYKRFKFADGTDGIVRLGQSLQEIEKEFSLSFYDEKGFSYIVNKDGDILVRPDQNTSDLNVTNFFDIISTDTNEQKDIKQFHESLNNDDEGAMRFNFNDETYVFAFVPINNIDGWYVVSIIPDSAIIKQTNKILNDSQYFIFIICAGMIILMVFMWIMHQYRKSVREKESMIEHQKQLFDILVNNTNDVFIMCESSDFSMKYVSPNVERILGIKLEEAEKNISVLGRASYSDGITIEYDDLRFMDSGSSKEYKTERIHRKTGEHRWYLETIYRTTVDESDRFVVTISDRTSEKQTEYILEESLRIAKEANEAKSTFLSNMSHDIRTPMNAITGIAELLNRNTENPEKIKEYASKITASSRHLLGLINDVLDMSKIESGNITLNISEISLAEITEEIDVIIRPQAKAKQQDFEIFVHDISNEHLLGDRVRINQILINILSNAIKYTPAGGRIELIINQLPHNSNNYVNLQFVIKDNGIGMSDDFQKNIFQPFSREISSVTNKVQGTGLGMAITKNLVDLMGGTIGVESKLGEGSVVTVNLNMRIQQQEEEHQFWEKYGIRNVLIVDDDVEICTNILSAMSGTGVAIQFALNGCTAIQMVEYEHKNNRDFDLILIDWKMPDLDGIETANRIRKIISNKVPIMILTAYDWQEIEKEGFEAGVSGFMQKPFFISNFKQTIKKLKSEEKKTEEKVEQQGSIFNGKRFLAAEDNELNSEILIELLGMFGAECDVAENGQKAVEEFEKSEPGYYDMILMDVQMPVMNGYEATKAIRLSSHPKAKTIPIIAMTANAFADDINDAKNAGMNEHVSKPIDMNRLESVIKDILSKG